MNSQLLALAEAALGQWCERLQLNLAQAIELQPGAPAQFSHRDRAVWQGSLGEVEYLVNVIWPLTSFNEENGATIVWPRSHGQAALAADPGEVSIVAEGEPSDAIVVREWTLHGARHNRSGGVRRGIISYSLGWLKPHENQWLAYPPEIAKDFPPELAALAGYVQHRPNPGYFEGQCPSILFGGFPHRLIGAVDALRPDQQSMLADHVAARRPADADRARPA